MRKIGIEVKLIAFVLVLLIIAMGTVILTSRQRSEILIADQMRESNRLVLSSLQWAIPQFMDEQEIDTIQRLLENIGSSKAVAELKLYSPGSVIIASGNPLEIGIYEKNELLNEIIQEKKLFGEWAEGAASSCFALPVHSEVYESRSSSDVSAVLFISADSRYFSEAFLPFQTSVIQASILIALILAFISHMFIRITIKNPLSLLINTVEEAERGNYKPGLNIKRPWEFKRFGEMFLRMLGEIEHQNSELAEYSETLEVMVENRTRDLDSSLNKLKNAQKTIIHQEKMASIGELAAGVAHEINNPTGFVIGNLSILKEYLDVFHEYYSGSEDLARAVSLKDEELIKVCIEKMDGIKDKEDMTLIFSDIEPIMDELNRGTARIKDIVRGLRDFARPDNDIFCPADINNGLDEAVKIAWNKIKYKAELIKEYGKIPEIDCNIQRLEQVFINLLTNAADAIDKEGTITIRTGVEDGTMVIEIEDTGNGIDEKHLGNIFDPFFTTKDVGKGTGLGLSISNSIIESHNGELSVRSSLGEGTVFSIKLPINKELEG
ncbi:MAG: GHKL domain-containing protein [Spirochaetales bacterium]|nr:GHKL domain-containing protein [Spirochaetales bacterium]